MLEKSEWNTINKSAWPDGEWKDEPDHVAWKDPETGLLCLIVRHRFGALWGWVGVSKGNQYFGLEPENLHNLEVYGGVSFAQEFRDGNLPGEEVWPIPSSEDQETIWWVGFDTMHLGDLLPGENAILNILEGEPSPNSYKNLKFVKKQVRELAKQIFNNEINQDQNMWANVD